MIAQALSYPFMWWALAACLVLAGIHAYLGFHVLSRGVIFVDLALAQMAALGMAVAILFGLHDHPAANYLLPVTMTVAGALVFASLRRVEHRVPLEAFIGIVFAAAQAAGILVLENSPSGTEHLKETLIGSVFTVAPQTVLRTALIYAVVGGLHFLLRKPLFAVTNDTTAAERSGHNVFWWDVFFYATFGIVVTSSVRIAGVLLVFGLLVIPAVAGVLVSSSIGGRLAAGWVFAFACSAGGLLAAFGLNLPAAPAILSMMTMCLMLLGGVVWVQQRIRATSGTAKS